MSAATPGTLSALGVILKTCVLTKTLVAQSVVLTLAWQTTHTLDATGLRAAGTAVARASAYGMTIQALRAPRTAQSITPQMTAKSAQPRRAPTTSTWTLMRSAPNAPRSQTRVRLTAQAGAVLGAQPQQPVRTLALRAEHAKTLQETPVKLKQRDAVGVTNQQLASPQKQRAMPTVGQRQTALLAVLISTVLGVAQPRNVTIVSKPPAPTFVQCAETQTVAKPLTPAAT